MKINQPNDPQLRKTTQPQEQQRKTRQHTESVSQNEDNAVVMNVSQRRAIDSSGEVGAYDPKDLSSLKELILKDPDKAVSAQSNSSPERVLQLLA